MSNNVSVILDAASVQVIDTVTSTYRVNSAIGDITLNANEASYQSFLPVATAGTALTLPTTTIWVVYVKNLDAAATLTVQVQPTGGALPSAANSPVLPPGGVYIYWAPLETSGGITAVTLKSSAGPTAAEVLLAA
jgi:hypothetical protein